MGTVFNFGSRGAKLLTCHLWMNLNSTLRV
jgi:hypothetical protein